jgi:hypothetical protein
MKERRRRERRDRTKISIGSPYTPTYTHIHTHTQRERECVCTELINERAHSTRGKDRYSTKSSGDLDAPAWAAYLSVSPSRQ